MDSKYPVGTPEPVISACEDLFIQAEMLMVKADLPAEYVRGFYVATVRLRELLETAADIESATRAETIKKNSERMREERNGQPS